MVYTQIMAHLIFSRFSKLFSHYSAFNDDPYDTFEYLILELSEVISLFGQMTF